MYYDEADIGFQLAGPVSRVRRHARRRAPQESREILQPARGISPSTQSRLSGSPIWEVVSPCRRFISASRCSSFRPSSSCGRCKGATRFAWACVLGYVDGFAGRMGARARDVAVSMLGRNTAWNLLRAGVSGTRGRVYRPGAHPRTWHRAIRGVDVDLAGGWLLQHLRSRTWPRAHTTAGRATRARRSPRRYRRWYGRRWD